MIHQHPILYSFRRCPYAIRARLALCHCNISIILREIDLKNKPQALLQASPKATVPVLKLIDGTIIDESLDIINHCATQYPASELQLAKPQQTQYQQLIDQLHQRTIPAIRRIKYHDRYPDCDLNAEYDTVNHYLNALEANLQQHRYLFKESLSKADFAILPLIRQCYLANQERFLAQGYQNVNNWLLGILKSPLFNAVMKKFPIWQPQQADVYL